jgi:hypothetical protein
MNKHHVSVIIYLAMVLLTPILLISAASKDVSWISEVENYIKKENWIPNEEYAPLAYASFFLYENGEEQFFLLSSQREFISYMDALAGRVTVQTRSSISREFVDEILAADRVLSYVHRFPEGFGPLGLCGSFEVAYFILEDKLWEDLEGKIIMQDRRAGEYSHYSVWQIPNWIFW